MPPCPPSRIALALLLWMATLGSAHASDRVPLTGTSPRTPVGPPSVISVNGSIVSIDTALVQCSLQATFSDLEGGEAPGTNYDDVLSSGGLFFSERFVGQSVSSAGDFDVILGVPSNPLQPQAGEAGQNLDVFDYAGNMLTGLGPLGFPEGDAIGEGAMAIRFPADQSKVKLTIVGGNGGTATLKFYRSDGSLIDELVVSNLTDLGYAFGTSDDSRAIEGILIENADPSGIGLGGVCYDDPPVSTHQQTWGTLKRRYR